MRITDVINHKGSSVVTAGPDQDLAHLVRLLTEHNIGAVVIAGPDGSASAAAAITRIGRRNKSPRVAPEGVSGRAPSRTRRGT